MKVRVRQGLKGVDSVSLRLADGFLRDFKSKEIEDVYSIIEKGGLGESDDLYFTSWEHYEDLLANLNAVLNKIGVVDYESYKKSVGITDRDISKCESWQVLSPVKYKEASGTYPLNIYLQEKFLGHKLAGWRSHRFYAYKKSYPAPFGKTKDVIHEDKVIQVRNTRKLKCQPYKKEPYVANGEIGIARWTFNSGSLKKYFKCIVFRSTRI